MGQYKRPVFDEAALGRNPNVGTVVIPARQVSMPGQYIKQQEEGPSLLVPNVVTLESTPMIKVFVSSDRRKRLNGLKPSASKLWLWIQQELEHGVDYVWINKVRYMEESGIESINTYKEALRILLRTEFLSLTLVADVYWINSDYVFMGDRIKRYPNAVKLSSTNVE